MMKMYAMGGAGMGMDMFGGGETLVLNANNKLVKYILGHGDSEPVTLFCYLIWRARYASLTLSLHRNARRYLLYETGADRSAKGSR